jgi:predicted ribosome quality control (RQC) complex YloA/Tae2 family protein
MKTILINNLLCNIGGNAKENWSILSNSNDNDLFFHLTSFSSCYVICETDNIPDISTIKEIALICKQNTKYKNVPNIRVDYTECKNVMKGDVVGEVIYKSNKKVYNVII